jgi:hypothetical protein
MALAMTLAPGGAAFPRDRKSSRRQGDGRSLSLFPTPTGARRGWVTPVFQPLRGGFLLGAKRERRDPACLAVRQAAGEKVPGAKRAIGTLGYRRYLARQPGTPPAAHAQPRRTTTTPPGLLRRVLMRWSPRAFSSAGASGEAAA